MSCSKHRLCQGSDQKGCVFVLPDSYVNGDVIACDTVPEDEMEAMRREYDRYMSRPAETSAVALIEMIRAHLLLTQALHPSVQRARLSQLEKEFGAQ